MTSPGELYLRDVFDIPEDVHAGDFKIELSGGFGEAERRVDEYVVTPQLKEAFRRSLGMVKAAVRDDKSETAYLHGSFGSGKSHFMTVLHAVLDNDPVARRKPELQDVIADHDDWLRGRRFMMVPFHLVGSADLDSAILGGYVAAAHRLGLSTPPVYRSDAMLADARRQREFLADDAKFAAWLGAGASTPQSDDDDLDDLDSQDHGGWSGATLDRALSAPVGDPLRSALESALLDGPMSSYASGARGAAEAFLPLENGLAVMSRHTKQHGYDGLILFLDELILWLQAHMSNQEMVNNEVSKLVKLIESGDTDRPAPIVSFISRQRNLSQLVGADVIGADAKNLEAEVEYLAGRFTVIPLEDKNLPEIIKRRVLKPKAGQETILDDAFAGIESSNAAVRDVLLDVHGATHADWNDFRDVYPLSPALLNVLVALAGALQRERTGLKLLSEMLRLRRDDMRIGQIIPLGDLWDVLSTGIGEAFTDHLRQESEAAVRLHGKVRAYLVEKYGNETDERFRADERIVKTLILSALAPDVPALTRLTGARLAALNLGSIRSRTVPPGNVVVSRLRELIGAGFGEIRADGDQDPVFTLHLLDLDVEPLLDRVGEQDNLGARRIWVKNQLWEALGVKDSSAFVCERELVWRGSRRTAEFVFENVRDPARAPGRAVQTGSGGPDPVRPRLPLRHRRPVSERRPRPGGPDAPGRVHRRHAGLAAGLPVRPAIDPARTAPEDQLSAGAGPAQGLRRAPGRRSAYPGSASASGPARHAHLRAHQRAPAAVRDLRRRREQRVGRGARRAARVLVQPRLPASPAARRRRVRVQPDGARRRAAGADLSQASRPRHRRNAPGRHDRRAQDRPRLDRQGHAGRFPAHRRRPRQAGAAPADRPSARTRRGPRRAAQRVTRVAAPHRAAGRRPTATAAPTSASRRSASGSRSSAGPAWTRRSAT